MNIRKAKIQDIADIQKLMDELNAYRKQIFSEPNREFHTRHFSTKRKKYNFFDF